MAIINLNTLVETFRMRWDSFAIGCDSMEETGKWDKAEYGEMEAFFENDLSSIVIRLICADGHITDSEVSYMNNTFGYAFTRSDLEELFDKWSDNFQESFCTSFKENYQLLNSINDKMAEAYRNLISLVCDIISESDLSVSTQEKEEISFIKNLLES